MADELVRVGFSEGTGRYHIGQGTANRVFVFHDSFLEFLWVADPQDTCEGMSRTRLVNRCKEHRDVCPFGIALRTSAPSAEPLFPCWDYRPPYLPTGMSIPVATSSEDLMEPLLFLSPDRQANSPRPPQHAIGGHTIAGVVLTLRRGHQQSDALQAVAALDDVAIQHDDDWLLDVFIEGLNHPVDLRPEAPLRLRPWKEMET